MINDAAKFISNSMTKWTADITNAIGHPFVIKEVKVEGMAAEMKTLSVDTRIVIDDIPCDATVTKVIVGEAEGSLRPIHIQVFDKDLTLHLPAKTEEEQGAPSSPIPEEVQSPSPNFEDLEAAAFQMPLDESLFSPLIDELQTKNNALIEEVCELKSKVTEYKNTFDEMEKGMASAKLIFIQELEEKTNIEYQTLKFENENLLTDNKIKEKQIKELNQQVANLKLENKTLSINNDVFNASLDKKENTIGKLTKKLTDQTNEISSLRFDNQQLHEALAAQPDPTTAAKTQLERQVLDLTKENKELRQELVSSEEHLKIINTEHEKEIKVLRRQLLEAVEAKTELADEVSALQAQLSSSESQALED